MTKKRRLCPFDSPSHTSADAPSSAAPDTVPTRWENLPKPHELHLGLIFHFKGLSSGRPFFCLPSAGFNQCDFAGVNSSAEDGSAQGGVSTCGVLSADLLYF